MNTPKALIRRSVIVALPIMLVMSVGVNAEEYVTIIPGVEVTTVYPDGTTKTTHVPDGNGKANQPAGDGHNGLDYVWGAAESMLLPGPIGDALEGYQWGKGFLELFKTANPNPDLGKGYEDFKKTMDWFKDSFNSFADWFSTYAEKAEQWSSGWVDSWPIWSSNEVSPPVPSVIIDISEEMKQYNQALLKDDISKHMQGWGEWGDLANSWQGSGVVPGTMPGGTFTTPAQMDNLLRPDTGVLTYTGNTVTHSTQDGNSISRSGGPITLAVDFSNRSFSGSTSIAEDRSNPDLVWYGFTLNMAGSIDRNGLNGGITNYTNNTTGASGSPASQSFQGKFYGPNAEGVGGAFSFSPGLGQITGSFGAKR